MEIAKWEKGQVVKLTQKEALTLIASLARQLSDDSERAEFYTKEDEYYLSVAVLSENNELVDILENFRYYIKNSSSALELIDATCVGQLIKYGKITVADGLKEFNNDG